MTNLTKTTERVFHILEKYKAINVEVTSIILEDGIEISRSTKSTGYSMNDRAVFLADIPDGVAYADLAGLIDERVAETILT